ncbi:MAG: glutamine--fructose-6-phosphate transaminase (isomerizing) [Magnetococcales bacterium]|nr:glutamine--fructose-6-phosphate transaminase (isomerizing) [Magnetococcales bacterium]
MCGIIGVISERNVTPMLVEGLKRLEYRGYDSAGVVVIHDQAFGMERATGKLIHLENRLSGRPTPLVGFVGIGHTRWATHGAPSEHNAHPHCSEDVAVVHNGIIENYLALREELQARGVVFASETDTEVIPHLITLELRRGLDPVAAVQAAASRLQGAFALGVLVRSAPNMLIALRRGSPLILGLGDGENFIASDATPLVPYTRRMVYLNDNDMAVLTREGVTLTDLEGRPVHRSIKVSQLSSEYTEKWPYRHFMQKEIFEQPTAIGETLKSVIHAARRQVGLEDIAAKLAFDQVGAITIVACGTSWHAGMVAKYWIEQLARLPVAVDIASEFRYREPPLLPKTLMVVISQSGETADTLAALRYAQGQGQRVLGIVNVPESTIAREADSVLYTQAGPEIGVASTKAFTTQLIVLASLALALGRSQGHLTADREAELVGQLLHLPVRVEEVLTQDETIARIARELMHANGFLFLGRGSCFPIALEGALKLKEISYIHAEGYAAGEMKHGPIALIDEELPVVVVGPRDGLFDKLASNVEEVKARGGRVVVLTTEQQGAGQSCKADFRIPMADCGDFVAPILYVIPLQLLAYHIAVLKGTDVDQPRNLAKSVTVE